MRLKYSAHALNIYCKQTGLTLAQVAEKTGLAYATVNRYARGERLPDIEHLLRICNALHLGICHFFIHPDIELTSVCITIPEEWEDIIFRYDRIEAIRQERSLTKTELLKQINGYAGCHVSRQAYNELITGKSFRHDAIFGLIGSQDVELAYLFEQPHLQQTEDVVVIPRKKLMEMKDYIAKLENAYRELEVKNKRLEKKVLPRYEERMENLDAQKIIRKFARSMERELAELKSWFEEKEL